MRYDVSREYGIKTYDKCVTKSRINDHKQHEASNLSEWWFLGFKPVFDLCSDNLTNQKRQDNSGGKLGENTKKWNCSRISFFRVSNINRR